MESRVCAQWHQGFVRGGGKGLVNFDGGVRIGGVRHGGGENCGVRRAKKKNETRGVRHIWTVIYQIYKDGYI